MLYSARLSLEEDLILCEDILEFFKQREINLSKLIEEAKQELREYYKEF